jgi:hypothetical protein
VLVHLPLLTPACLHRCDTGPTGWSAVQQVKALRWVAGVVVTYGLAALLLGGRKRLEVGTQLTAMNATSSAATAVGAVSLPLPQPACVAAVSHVALMQDSPHCSGPETVCASAG